MKIYKKTTSLVLSFLILFQVYVSASVIGSEQVSGFEYKISDGLTLVKNVFLGDQSGVGLQSENYFHFVPGGDTIPCVTVGEYVYGGENINKVYSYLKENGKNPVGGVNGDFFSMETGIPLGQVVVDNKIITNDGKLMPAIGFMDDGTAFIDNFELNISMIADEVETSLPYYNKYLQKWNYYLFDENYYNKITPSVKASYITFEIEEGSPTIGGVIRAKVISIETDTEEEKMLFENQLVLAVSDDASEALKEDIKRFYVDQIVEFNFNTNDDEKWTNAKHILASSAGQLIKDSQGVMDSKESASPRTAVGIKEDGSVIFYTIDGRQPSYSYGLRIPTLISRLLELGCVDALNLDGGGSTTISATYPGTTDFALVNSPSDKRLRNDATYIFFENTAPETGDATQLFIYPGQDVILSGSRITLDAKATDSGFYPRETEETPAFSIDGKKLEADEDGKYKIEGDGVITITANSDGITGEKNIICIKNPDEIRVTNNNKKIQSIEIIAGNKIDLDASAHYKTKALYADTELFVWSADEKIGRIDENGVFEATTPGKGYIYISAGESTTKIEVCVKSDGSLVDIEENWAKDYIEFLHGEKVVTGEERADGYFYFNPSEHVSRNQLAVILTKALKLDVSKYEDVELPFEDNNEIPSWALGYVKAVYKEGILKGASDGEKLYFNPYSKITRAEAFTTIGRIMKLEYENECDFSDRDEIPKWAVEYVDALYDNGMINGYDNNTLRPLSNVTKAELSKIIVKSVYIIKEDAEYE